jgi:hypothetical protein
MRNKLLTFLEEKKNETQINSFIGNGNNGGFGAVRINTGRECK